MESIYFEKQQGLLCAQHCLNALLQGQYFTAVDLAKIAKDLDEEEKQRMAELGEDTAEYRRFIQQPSGNMDDSGYFSVQVISRCLSIWNLELVRYGSSERRALVAQQAPADERAYICNYSDHWFSIRKLGNQWFNLNSVSKGPKLISDTFLALFLAQLQQEGYSIFIVEGELPQCEADRMLLLNPVKMGTAAPPSSPNRVAIHEEAVIEAMEESERQQAIMLSLPVQTEDAEDEDLRRAIELSLSSNLPQPHASNSNAVASSADEEGAVGGCEEMDTELEAAVRLSMECVERA